MEHQLTGICVFAFIALQGSIKQANANGGGKQNHDRQQQP
jgi:hypothetical protein